jgi:hypothetical protein
MLSICYVNGQIYLQNYCGQSYKVYGEITIRLFRYTKAINNINCSMTLTTSSGTKLKARFLDYTQGDMSFLDNRCNKQAIFLNNFFNPSGYCRFLKPSETYDLGSVGSLRYEVHDYSILFTNVASARILVTEVTEKIGGSCPSNLFDCEHDNECIGDDQTCNGNDNCGNSRDEIEGCGLTTGAIVGIVFGCLGFIAIVIIGVLLFKKFN